MIRETLEGNGIAEGSHVIKGGNYYYLLTAEGGTEMGYSEYIFRSEDNATCHFQEKPMANPN